MASKSTFGTYLLARRPQLGELVGVHNDDNVHYGRWGRVIRYSPEFEQYEVELRAVDATEDLPAKPVITRWFNRFEIGWDHMH